jgi:hypothetical protein
VLCGLHIWQGVHEATVKVLGVVWLLLALRAGHFPEFLFAL